MATRKLVAAVKISLVALVFPIPRSYASVSVSRFLYGTLYKFYEAIKAEKKIC